MPQYVIPQKAQSAAFDSQADAEFTTGSDAVGTAQLIGLPPPP
jgi:hypothetical protein